MFLREKKKIKKKTTNPLPLPRSDVVLCWNRRSSEDFGFRKLCRKFRRKMLLFFVQHKSLFRQQCSHPHQEGVERKWNVQKPSNKPPQARRPGFSAPAGTAQKGSQSPVTAQSNVKWGKNRTWKRLIIYFSKDRCLFDFISNLYFKIYFIYYL